MEKIKAQYWITDDLKITRGWFVVYTWIEPRYHIYFDMYIDNEKKVIEELTNIWWTTYRLLNETGKRERYLIMNWQEIYYSGWNESQLQKNWYKKVTFVKDSMNVISKLDLICNTIWYDLYWWTKSIDFSQYGIKDRNDYIIDEYGQTHYREIHNTEIIFSTEFRDKLRDYYLENIADSESTYERYCIYNLMLHLDDLEEYLYDLLNIKPLNNN